MSGISIMDRLTTREIKDQAFRALVEAGEAQTYQLIDPVLAAYGVNRAELPSTWASRKSQERFLGRLRTALNELAAEAAIVKIGIGSQLPNGTTADRTNVAYFSKEAYQQALARYEAANEARNAEEERWQGISDRLDRAAFRRDEYTVITADAWESLLAMAGL